MDEGFEVSPCRFDGAEVKGVLHFPDRRRSAAPQALPDELVDLCLLFIHPRAPNLISLRSAGTMPA